MIWAVDLVMAVTGKKNNRANQVLRELPADIFEDKKFVHLPTPGNAHTTTRLLAFRDALELILVLPGKIAKEQHKKAADILTRYYAGDSTLVRDIEANAESQAPVNQLARAALGKRELELEALEIQERRARIKHLEGETQKAQAEAQDKWIQLYTSLCPNKTMDERARLHFKDNVMNLSASGGQKTIENGADDTRPITISTLAAQLGLKFTSGELQSIGIEVKKRYYEKYKADPPRHEQQVNGAVRNVCSYTERDRGLVEAVLKEYKRA